MGEYNGQMSLIPCPDFTQEYSNLKSYSSSEVASLPPKILTIPKLQASTEKGSFAMTEITFGRANQHTHETENGENTFPSLTKTTKKSHEPTQKREEVIIKQPEDTAAEHVVKREDDSSYALAHHSEGLENMAIRAAGAQDSQKRDPTHSFQTLEKGIIYFFYRSRVDSSGTYGLEDVARSFIVLRPTPRETATSFHGGSITLGKTFRVLVVPKKVLPSSSRTKEMGFVEKAGINLKELQETLITELHYDTKTHGPRTVPEARMYAKGVYSITSTQHGSYLAYILTDPRNIGSVQENFGLRERGKWLVQSKNPEVVSPPSVSLTDKPKYPTR